MPKKAKRSKPRRTAAPHSKETLCDRMKVAASQVAREHGFEIMNMRCSLMSAMFVPGNRPERRMAFSFTVVGKDGKR